MRRLRFLTCSILVVFALVACSLFQTTTTITAKDKALFFVSTWNKQYEDTVLMASRANLTDAQKKIVIIKRDLLIRSKPFIATYVNVVVSGGIPGAEIEATIYDLLNQLATAGGGGLTWRDPRSRLRPV